MKLSVSTINLSKRKQGLCSKNRGSRSNKVIFNRDIDYVTKLSYFNPLSPTLDSYYTTNKANYSIMEGTKTNTSSTINPYQDDLNLALEKKSIIFDQKHFNKAKEANLKEQLTESESKINQLKSNLKTLYDNQSSLIREIDALKCNLDFFNNIQSYSQFDAQLTQLYKTASNYDLSKRVAMGQLINERYSKIKAIREKDEQTLMDCRRRYQDNCDAIKDSETKIKTERIDYADIKKQLLVHYHNLLLEGKDTREEGLSWIIREIWKLNSNIIMSNFPAFLDEEAITFLFNYSTQHFQLIKLQDQIKNNKTSVAKQPLFTQNYTIKPSNKKNAVKQLLLKLSKDSNEKMEEQRIHTLISTTKSQAINQKTFECLILVKSIEKKIEAMKSEMSQSKLNEVKRIKREFAEFDYEKKYNASIGSVISAIAGEEAALLEVTSNNLKKQVANSSVSSMDNFKSVYNLRFPMINVINSKKFKKSIEEKNKTNEDNNKKTKE